MLEASTYSILVLTTVTGQVTAAATALDMPPDRKACPDDSSPCLLFPFLLPALYMASLINSNAKKCTPTPRASRATVGDVPLQRPLHYNLHCQCAATNDQGVSKHTVPNALLLHYNAKGTWSASCDALASICLQSCADHIKRLHTCADYCS